MKLETFFKNFEIIAEAPGGVKKIREMILQMAVTGKLLAQREEEGSAEEAETIFGPFPIPSSWRWSRLDDVTSSCGQKTPDRDFTYIDVSSIDNVRGVISDETSILTPAEAPSRARKLIKKDAVIYSTVRPYLLNIAVIEREYFPEPIVSTAFAVLCPTNKLASRFLYLCLRANFFIDYVSSVMTGMAYPAINDSKLKAALIPIPPLKEQDRIVERVDSLMTLCDELEEKQRVREEACSTIIKSI